MPESKKVCQYEFDSVHGSTSLGSLSWWEVSFNTEKKKSVHIKVSVWGCFTFFLLIRGKTKEVQIFSKWWLIWIEERRDELCCSKQKETEPGRENKTTQRSWVNIACTCCPASLLHSPQDQFMLLRERWHSKAVRKCDTEVSIKHVKRNIESQLNKKISVFPTSFWPIPGN